MSRMKKSNMPVTVSQDSSTCTLVVRFTKNTSFSKVKQDINKEFLAFGQRRVKVLQQLPYENKQNEYEAPDDGYDYYYVSSEPKMTVKDSELNKNFPNLVAFNSKSFRVKKVEREVSMVNREISPVLDFLYREYACLRMTMKSLQEEQARMSVSLGLIKSEPK